MDELPAENYIKRERQRKEENQKIIDKMRTDLPVYNMDEIRQYKLPFDEALIIGLEEKGYVSTASFLEELFEYQANLRDQAGAGTMVWLRPLLIASRAQLEYLSNGLRSSEDNHQRGKYLQECEEFLELAVYFAFDNPDWWWLGEQLLMQAIRVSSGYESLGGKYEALSRFAYGKFLIENVKEDAAALEQLKIARELCEGKGWTSKTLFPEETGTLFMQVNHYIFRCLYREAKYLMKIDVSKALAVAVEARKRAAESCHHEAETKILMLKGTCEMESHDVKSAINSFVRAYHLQQKLHSVEGTCIVRIQLAKAYLIGKNAQMALETLMLLKEDAEKYNLPFYLGQAYKNLGEYYLVSGEPDKANSLLNEAMNIFQECQVETPDVEMVRNLEAISAGLELFPDYVKLIHESGANDSDGFRNLLKMVAWKDERTPFWNVENRVERNKSLGEIIGRKVQPAHQESEEVTEKEAVAEQESEPTESVVDMEEREEKRPSASPVDTDDPKAVIELLDNKETFKSESEAGLAGPVEDEAV